jgi:hypothetical protein
MRTCREQLARHASLKRKRRREQAMLRNGGVLPGRGRGARDDSDRPAKQQQQRQGAQHTQQQQQQQLDGWPLSLLQSLAAAGPGLPRDAAAALLLQQAPPQGAMQREEHQLHSAFADAQANQQACVPALGALLGMELQPSVNSQSELQQALMACWHVETPSPQPQPSTWLPAQQAPHARQEQQDQAHRSVWSAWHQATAAAAPQAARQCSWPLEQQSCGTRFDLGESRPGMAAACAPAPAVHALSCGRQSSEELLLAGLCSLLQAAVAELQQTSEPAPPAPPPARPPAGDVLPLHSLLTQIAAVNPAFVSSAAVNTHADSLSLAALQHMLGQH